MLVRVSKEIKKIEKQKIIGAGELIQSSWRFYLKHWKLLVGIVAMVYLPFAIVKFFLYQLKLVHRTNLLVVNLLNLVGLFIGAFITIALINAIDSIFRGNQISARKAYRLVPSRFWAYIITMILAGLIVSAGVFLFVIPGFIFFVWFAFAGYTVVIEKVKGSRALGRSKELVSGHWGKVFWCLLASSITYTLFSSLLFLFLFFSYQLVKGGLGEATFTSLVQDKTKPIISLLTSIPDTLFWSLFILFPFLLYRDLKRIKAAKE